MVAVPKGVTPRQMRLAALLPRAESAYAALIEAGYSPKTAHATALRTRESAGVIRAREALDRAQADSARGLVGAGKRALAKLDADINELDARDRLAFGLKAYELGHTLGENVEQRGNADAWRARLRWFGLRMYALGARRQRMTTETVVTPPPNPRSRRRT